MAVDMDDTLEGGRSLRWRRFKGQLFEGLLAGSTLIGLAALGALFVYISLDALGLTAAAPSWYLLYFATLVLPVSAYTLYIRRRPAVAAVNARAFAVVFGTLVLSLLVYAVPAALGPHDVLLFLLFGTLPPLAVVGHAKTYGESHLTGPAIPVSVILGIGAGFLLYSVLAPVFTTLIDWVAYLFIVTLPIALAVGVLADRRWGRRAALGTAGAVVAAALAGLGGALALGQNPSLWVVLGSGFVAPVVFVYVDTLRNAESGRIGLLGPVVLVGGIVLGATLESLLGITGLESWLTPTLLLESWSSVQAEQAGVYPQIIGSIMIVGLMGLLSFPVGIGAAIYLEEYAPSTGWRGRLATALDVNISNLAGVPSVVYGLLGLALFRQVFGLQPGILLAAAATLGLLSLPIVIVAAQEALRSVPDAYRQGSYGMGASRWQTLKNVVLPEAVPGILTGTILALGRAIGETAPLVMIGVATTRFSPPDGLFSGATALPLQIFAAAGNAKPEYRTGVVAAAAIVLLVLMLIMNATAILIRNRYEINSTKAE
jgi:phosphate transport system permease protein